MCNVCQEGEQANNISGCAWERDGSRLEGSGVGRLLTSSQGSRFHMNLTGRRGGKKVVDQFGTT